MAKRLCCSKRSSSHFQCLTLISMMCNKMLTWTEKLHVQKEWKVVRLEKKFADMPIGCKMLVATPLIVDSYIQNIPFGESVSFPTMREDLARLYQAEKTCPVSTGIFLRISAEASYEEFQQVRSDEKITPFWRAIDQNMKVAKKLTCGISFISERRLREGIELQPSS